MNRDDQSEISGQTQGVDARLMRHGGLTYLEIPAIDLRVSAEFYATVLGWLMRGDESEPKFSDQTGDLIGRWVLGRKVSRRAGLLPFIYVDRIDDVVTLVSGKGGEIVKAPYAEGDLRVALIRDPAGNLIGLWQAGAKR